jgi:integrase
MSGRRANGEGDEPTQLADGRWRARYRSSDGRRLAVYSRISKADCRRLRDDALDRARTGLTPLTRPARRYTLGDWMTEWIATWIDDGAHAPRTVHNYRANTKNHLDPILHRPLRGPGALSGADIKVMLNRMARNGSSETTRQLVYGMLNTALDRAVLEDKADANIIRKAGVPRPVRDTEEVQPWTDDQANAFLDSVAGDRLEALWNVMLLGGLRQGEVIGLRWTDIDWVGEEIHVRGQLDRFTHQWKKRKGKGKPYDVPMAGVVIDLLRARVTAQKEEQIRAGRRWAGNEQNLVFTTRKGTPIPHNNIGEAYRIRVKRAGLPHVKFHGGRHFFASAQYAGGARDGEVSAALGQSDPSSMRTYVHLRPRVKDDVRTRMDAVRPRRPRVVGG